jgi:ABC-type multidrug transport system ATPase subunit
VKFEVTVRLNKQDAKLKGTSTVKQEILKGVSGYAMPGQTLFIMGSSGAGKTSLLNILSDRIGKRSGQKVEGKVLVNDTIELKQDLFGKVAGYVMQDDVLFEHFTPREALTFAARLKLKTSVQD